MNHNEPALINCLGLRQLLRIKAKRPRWGGESARGRTGKGAKKPDTIIECYFH